jgi:tetratricopeptide (TPR) repeat protein
LHIVFIGNCQVVALSTIYQTFVVPHTGDEVQSLGCNATSADNLRSIETADVVVEQVFDLKQGIDLDTLALRGKRVRVPVVGAPFLWPFGGSAHPESLNRYGGYDPFRQEMGDGYLNRLLKEGLGPEEAARRYIDADVSRLVDLDRLREITMDRQRARDAATGYRCADLIEDEIAEQQLFLTPFHPTLTVSRYIARHFLQYIGAPSSAIDRVERYMTDSFYFKFGLPIHPSVARHFGLRWADAETRYRFHDEGYLTFAEFVHRYVECRASTALPAALVAAAEQRPDAGSLIEAALAECPESALALFALGKLRTSEGRHGEAIPILKRALECEPDLEWAHFILAECMQKSGELDAAEYHYRAEAALRPYRAPVPARLAHFLASRRKFDEAVAAIEIAVEMEPGNAEDSRSRDGWKRAGAEAALVSA